MTPRVVLIRPQGRNEAIAGLLRALGLSPVICPVLSIEAHDPGAGGRQWAMNLDAYDHVIFVSRNAVRFGLPYIGQYWPQLPHHVTWYAVGPATAEELMAFDIAAVTPDIPTSEGLLEVPSLRELKETKVLIVRGVGGRALLEEALSARGASVDCLEVYARAPRTPDEAERQSVAAIEAGVALVYSGETLQAFCEALSPDRERFELVVPSERIRDLAVTAGFAKVHVASGPTDDAMLAATELAIGNFH